MFFEVTWSLAEEGISLLAGSNLAAVKTHFEVDFGGIFLLLFHYRLDYLVFLVFSLVDLPVRLYASTVFM